MIANKEKSELQFRFEKWAEKNRFKCDWDEEMDFYIDRYTQGAWNAFQEGYRQCWDIEE